MEALYQRCAGLDVHKKTVTACLIVPGPDGRPKKEIRTFGTMTMESTGVFWKPVYNILEGSFEVILANAREVKNVPGRKTDVSDAEWIADLLRHGLLRGSFIPEKPVRELRDLTRFRSSLIRERASHVNRLQSVLEDSNIKLSSVATDIMGVSAKAMIKELLSGKKDPQSIADLARGRMRSKIPELEKALEGFLRPHHRLMISEILCVIDGLDEAIKKLDSEIEERIRPFEEEMRRLDEVPGLDERSIQCIIAEIGADMSPFPTHKHVSSWAGVCPGNNESAGKRRSGKTTKGSPYLKATLVQVAHSAGRTKGRIIYRAQIRNPLPGPRSGLPRQARSGGHGEKA